MWNTSFRNRFPFTIDLQLAMIEVDMFQFVCFQVSVTSQCFEFQLVQVEIVHILEKQVRKLIQLLQKKVDFEIFG